MNVHKRERVILYHAATRIETDWGGVNTKATCGPNLVVILTKSAVTTSAGCCREKLKSPS